MAVLFFKDPALGWTSLAQGPAGPTGPVGPTGPIGVSADANNAAVISPNDGLIYVPQIGGVTGSIVMFASATAPVGWAICDGRAHGSPALEAIIGSANTPDLKDKFVRGWGAAGIGTTGGTDAATLTIANMPSHDHSGVSGPHSVDHTHTGTSGTMNSNWSHAHGGSTGTESADHAHHVPDHGSGGFNSNHNHTVLVNEGSGEGADGNFIDTNPNSDGNQKAGGNTDWDYHNHSHVSPGFSTGGISANHTHGVTVNAVDINHTHALTTGGSSVPHTHTVTAQGSGTPLPIMPSYIVLSYIVKL